MPALSFKSQFVGEVQTGRKTQTVRAPRKHLIKVGDRLILATGMRTKQYRQIGEGTCTEVLAIIIECPCTTPSISIDGRELSDDEIEQFAKADGFESSQRLAAWFDQQHGLPFAGTVIKWKLHTAP